MKYIRAINQKATRIEIHTRREREAAANGDSDVVALESQAPGPHIPLIQITAHWPT